MKTVVYADILVTVNFVVNYFLLLCTASLSGRKIRRARVALAAFLGGMSTLIIFFPPSLPLFSAFYKLAVAALMVFAAYKFLSVKQLVKDTFVLFTIAWLLAGILFAVWYNFAPSGMLFYNGVVYFDISAIVLICTTAVAYVLISVFSGFLKRESPDTATVKATIVFGGASVTLTAIEDSGNKLREPFSDAPVAVCNLEDVSPLLSVPMISAALEFSAETSADSYPPGFRVIPFNTVGKDGFMLGFRPDYILVTDTGKENYKIEEVYIGLSNKKIGDGSFEMLLGNEMLKLKI